MLLRDFGILRANVAFIQIAKLRPVLEILKEKHYIVKPMLLRDFGILRANVAFIQIAKLRPVLDYFSNQKFIVVNINYPMNIDEIIQNVSFVMKKQFIIYQTCFRNIVV